MDTHSDHGASGLLLADKPEGWTSHDVVNLVRRRFNVHKVGHCGTLDPMATGLLILVLGQATKLSSRLMTQDKVYSGTMRLGIRTHTQDRAGDILATKHVEPFGIDDIRQVAAQFTGDILQIPPMVSALKRGGKRLYKLARKGQEIEREPRPVTIFDLTIAEVQIPFVTFSVHCSKGTYVRTLCEDMGRELGCGAHLHDLRRLRSGSFRIEDACPVEDIKTWDRGTFMLHVTPLAEVVMALMDA